MNAWVTSAGLKQKENLMYNALKAILQIQQSFFVSLNSSLNPVIYFWKIPEARQALKTTIEQLRLATCPH